MGLSVFFLPFLFLSFAFHGMCTRSSKSPGEHHLLSQISAFARDEIHVLQNGCCLRAGGLSLTAISCASYPRFSRIIQRTTPSAGGRPTVLAKLNLLNAFSVSEVVVSSNGQIMPGFINISTY